MADNGANNENNEAVSNETGGFNHPCVVPLGDIADAAVAPITISRPADGGSSETALQEGQTYIFNFEESDVASFAQDGDDLILSFADGSTIVLQNFEAATSGDLPAALAFTNVLDAGDLHITEAQAETAEVYGPVQQTQELASLHGDDTAADDVVTSEEDVETTIISEDGEQVAAVEFVQDSVAEALDALAPASGEEDLASIAEELASIETAAGDEGSSGSESAGGFGFQSTFTPVGAINIDDIGPIAPTALAFSIPAALLDDLIEINGVPTILGTPILFVDETDGLDSVSGALNIDFGSDGFGGVAVNGGFGFGGSVAEGELTSGGETITVELTATGYIGTINEGETPVFELVVENDGSFTFAQIAPIDHGDANDADDVANLLFGVRVSDLDGDFVDTVIPIGISDDGPIELEVSGANSIDETDGVSGQSISGELDADFGADGQAAVNPFQATTASSFEASGSLNGGALTSAGRAVSVSLNDNTYTGTASDGTVVFTLEIVGAGSYDFTLNAPLDHADGNDANDVITLDFGVQALDFDGDATGGVISINVADDVITANADITPEVDEGDTINGNVLANDDLGADAAASIIAVTFDGQSFDVDPVNGAVITTTLGQLTLLANGDFEYTANENDPEGLDVFTYTAQDGDGDTDTATLSIAVDDTPEFIPPSLGAGVGIVDESDVPDGGAASIVQSVQANFGADAPGSFSATGTETFSASGSLLNGTLTSGGEVVTVSLTDDRAIGTSYVGTTESGIQVFDLNIRPDGSYQFNLTGGLDHADPDNPNDVIALDFGVTATDSDGDTDASTIRINVLDSVPSIGEAFGDVDESNFNPDGLDIIGHPVPIALGLDPVNRVSTGGPDDFSATDGNGNLLTLTSGGEPISVTIEGTQSSFYTGRTPDGEAVFALRINTEGTFDFNLIGTLDHPDGGDANDLINLTFGVSARSLDNTLVTNAEGITISIADDGVVARDDVNAAEEGQTVTGDLFDNDDLSNDGGNEISEITIDGETILLNGGSATATNELGSLTVNSDGSYSFTATDEGDPDGNFIFTYTLVDADGDSSVASDDADATTVDIRVTPDGEPVVVSGGLTVDETLVTPGPEGISGDIGVDFGLDGFGSIVTNGTITSFQNGSPIALTSGGVPVEITQTPNGYVGTAGADTIFTLTLNVSNAAQTFDFSLTGSLDHADSTNPNDAIDIRFGITAQDSDDDTIDGSIDITVRDDAPVAFDDDGGDVNEGDSVTGNVLTNDLQSEDGPTTVVEVLFNGAVTSVPADGASIAGAFGTLTIQQDGSYSYIANADFSEDGIEEFTYIVQDADGDRETAEITFDVTDATPVAIIRATSVVDESDGFAGLEINDAPIEVDFGLDGAGSTFASNSFSTGGGGGDRFGGGGGGGDRFGDTGSVSTGGGGGRFGEDAGTQTGLTSDGEPVLISLQGSTYIATAGGQTVFTLRINSNGTYDFNQVRALDHSNTSNPDDTITLNFGVGASDSDGDTITNATGIRIIVRDDGPTAVNDLRGTINDGDTITGNVITNDDVGADASGSITQITLNGLNLGAALINLPEDGSDVTIEAIGGTLTINNTGEYSYVSNNIGDTVTDNFTYTVADGDGDTATAELSVTVQDDDAPVAIIRATSVVDESDGFAGLEINDAPIEVDFGLDGAGSTFASNSFSASVSAGGGRFGGGGGGDRFGDTGSVSTGGGGDRFGGGGGGGRFGEDGGTQTGLTSDGEPVLISLQGSTYIATAGGQTVFTLRINSNGTYDFNQVRALDHSNTSDPNDTITLNFGVGARDADGDTITNAAGIRIIVRDDGPTAVDNNRSLADGNSITGNVITNDDVGADASSSITQIIFGGQVINLPQNGNNVTVNGNGGTLTINSTGAYTYASNNIDGSITDNFTYRLTDGDGDSDTAVLRINVEDDDQPVAVNDLRGTINDGTSINGNVITNDDVGADAPGSLTQITFGGQTIDIPQNGNNITINGGAGRLTINSTGAYTYRSNEADVRTTETDTFTYRLADSDGDSDTAILRVTVRDNDVPNAVNDSLRVTGDRGTGNVLSNDDFGADGPGSPQIVSFTIGGQTVSAGGTISTALGTVRLNNNGSFVLDRPDPTSSSTTSSQVIGTTTTGGGGGRFDNGTTTTTTTIRDTTTTTSTVDGGTLNVSYTIQDSDGDRDSATLNLNIVPVSNSSSSFVDRVTRTTTQPPPDRGDGGGEGGGSPLVLDLDGDGIELTTLEDGVLFDMEADGTLNQTAFADADDGLLVFDANGDGVINDQSELFSRYLANPETGETAENGFAALAGFDSNQDGVIDANDERFDELQVFQDRNQDGISQADELLGLSDLDITSINLDAQDTAFYVNGNLVFLESTFTFGDGTTNTIADAFFQFLSTEATEVFNAADVNVFGESGADTFAFETLSDVDVGIHRFDAAEGDVIDVSALIEDYDPLQDTIDEFVFTTEVDGATQISVDVDGADGAAEAQVVATLSDVTDLDVNESIII